MRKETFTNERTGVVYIRITKKTALKAFKAGKTLITCANNQIPTMAWCNWGIMEYNPDTTYFNTVEEEFEAIYNRNVYYNGKGVKFYIPQKVLETL